MNDKLIGIVEELVAKQMQFKQIQEQIIDLKNDILALSVAKPRRPIALEVLK